MKTIKKLLLEANIKEMENRLINIEMHPIAMDNQYRAIAKMKLALEQESKK